MNIVKIKNELVKQIELKKSKSEIFANLIETFGIEHQNLISEIILYNYEDLKNKHNPENQIKKEFIRSFFFFNSKDEIKNHLMKQFGSKYLNTIDEIVENNYQQLTAKRGVAATAPGVENHYDYLKFLSPEVKTKINRRSQDDISLQKELSLDEMKLTGILEIKNNTMLIEVFSYNNNFYTTALNLIAAVNGFFTERFTLVLANALGSDLYQIQSENSREIFQKIQHRKLLFNSTDNASYYQKQEKEILEVLYEFSPNHIKMVIKGT